jgi:hypothetical protein
MIFLADRQNPSPVTEGLQFESPPPIFFPQFSLPKFLRNLIIIEIPEVRTL